jgi:RNA polymerase sigma factor (sigma-70 family)
MDSEATEGEPTDEDLLRRLSDDPAAFEVFYRRHVDRVIGFAARRVRDPADAADLVAATFVTVLTAARSYDADRGEPGAWLLGITARLIANARRRKVRESAALARIAGRRLIDQSDIERLEERIDATRSSQAVLAALDRLRPKAREALLLVSAAGLRPAEAARVLGISPAAFRMRLSAARRALDKAIAAEDAAGDRQPGEPVPAAQRSGPPSAQNSALKEAVN